MASRFTVHAIILGGSALLTGCHAGGGGNLLAPRSEPILPKVSLTATEAIEKHNLNASRIQSLEAKPRITVKSAQGSTVVDGRMAMERPKNFKLQMFGPMRSPVADIGSNGDEFWFWTKAGRNSKENTVLVCSYDDLDRSSLSATFQPDWVIEAMGLRAISRDEAEHMTSKPGDKYGTIKLTSTRRGTGGETLTKETIIDQGGLIKEHRLYQGDKKKTLLAYAVVDEYLPVVLNGEGKGSVMLPSKFKLEWMREQLALDIHLEHPTVNNPITAEDRQARFSEPEIPGSKRVNLADYAASTPARASAEPPPHQPRTRSSRTAPTPGGNIRLGAPEPFGVEGASRAPTDPVALTASLRDQPIGGALDQVVRPGVPRPLDQ